jgi:hypothetical protein
VKIGNHAAADDSEVDRHGFLSSGETVRVVGCLEEDFNHGLHGFHG